LRSRRRYSGQSPQEPEGTPINLSEEEALPLLECGEITGGHRMPWGSNYTFLVRIDAGEGKYLRAIYKPRDGERPLWDYSHGTLYKREYATFVLSRALGWPNVPRTLIREGPYGIGSMQLYIDCDPEITYFNLIEEKAEDFQKFAIFDLVINNGDRKAGHCLLGQDGRVWSIDHGLTFHTSFKLRTVMLEFWGRPIPKPLVKDMEGLLEKLETPAHSLTCALSEMIAPAEMKALLRRRQVITRDPRLPTLDPYHNVPWPWV
jgi:uncharacterized repeat protein (TIGR03843 family)